jgi:hypothetical protein
MNGCRNFRVRQRYVLCCFRFLLFDQGGSLRISRSCREAHYFLFANRENCFPGSGRKSFLHIFSSALNQSLAGIQAELVFDVFAVGLDRFHAQVQ